MTIGSLYICDACEVSSPSQQGWATVVYESRPERSQCDVCPGCQDKPLRVLLVEIAARFRARGRAQTLGADRGGAR